MTDFFALLGQPRQPWLDPAVLRDAFHARAAVLHPDVATTGDAARFAELNTAYATLREPAARLRHLLALTAPEAPRQAAPPAELGDLFMRFGAWQQAALRLAARQAASTSPLTRALLAGEVAALQRDLTTLTGALESALATAEHDLRAVDPAGFTAAEIARLAARFSYLTRWLEQAREAGLRWQD